MSATFTSDALERLLPMMKHPRRFDVRQADRSSPQGVRHLYVLAQRSPSTAAAADAAEPDRTEAWLREAAGAEELRPEPGAGDVVANAAASEALVEVKAAQLLRILQRIQFNQVSWPTLRNRHAIARDAR